MKAVLHKEKSGIDGLVYSTAEDKRPGYGEVKVKLIAAGLNHRDLFVINDRNAGDTPLIPGSDGAGIVTEIGEDVSPGLLNRKVILNPTLNWEKADSLPEDLQIIGSPSDGTFADFIIVPAENAVAKPAHLTWEEASVLGLSALTAYRALFTRGGLRAGQHVVIPGIGGGVATIALQMAKAAGARVSVSSRSEHKLELARGLGADYCFESGGSWKDRFDGVKADLILDSIGPATFPNYFDILRPDGRIVSFGASSGDTVELPLRALFFPQLRLIGTSMGSTEEFHAMVDFVAKHHLKPVVHKAFPMRDAVQAFTYMKEGRQFGNLALSNDTEA
ncbi:quinone oxidoreductase family protein [Paenibacillus sp. 1P03SA]|uniref:quinone oxidoreductase family protein n=1 Tax=Paenibacillus sp. 1P03SA TaxID=3132294 RepID=UPI00399EF882